MLWGVVVDAGLAVVPQIVLGGEVDRSGELCMSCSPGMEPVGDVVSGEGHTGSAPVPC